MYCTAVIYSAVLPEILCTAICNAISLSEFYKRFTFRLFIYAYETPGVSILA